MGRPGGGVFTRLGPGHWNSAHTSGEFHKPPCCTDSPPPATPSTLFSVSSNSGFCFYRKLKNKFPSCMFLPGLCSICSLEF